MLKRYCLLLFLFWSLGLWSQEGRLSLELQFPATVDNNFIGSNYNGIIDVGAKYRFAQSGIFNFGAGLNLGLLTNPGNNDFGVD